MRTKIEQIVKLTPIRRQAPPWLSSQAAPVPVYPIRPKRVIEEELIVEEPRIIRRGWLGTQQGPPPVDTSFIKKKVPPEVEVIEEPRVFKQDWRSTQAVQAPDVSWLKKRIPEEVLIEPDRGLEVSWVSWPLYIPILVHKPIVEDILVEPDIRRFVPPWFGPQQNPVPADLASVARVKPVPEEVVVEEKRIPRPWLGTQAVPVPFYPLQPKKIIEDEIKEIELRKFRPWVSLQQNPGTFGAISFVRKQADPLILPVELDIRPRVMLWACPSGGTTLILDDQFQRNDSSYGSPGNGWLDPTNNWAVQDNLLTPQNADAQTWPSKPCLRPSGTTEGPLNQLVIVNVADAAIESINHKNVEIVLRSASDGSTCYRMYMNFVTGAVTVDKILSQVSSGNICTGTLSGVQVASPYIITFSALCVRATILRCTVRLASDPNTILLDISGVDSQSILQAAGQMGVSSRDLKTFTRIRTYNFGGTIPMLDAVGTSTGGHFGLQRRRRQMWQHNRRKRQ